MNIRRLRPLVALLAGVIHACSFAPFDLPWLQVLALAALFALAAHAGSARSAGLLGFAFGMGWFGVGVSWVYISMHVYGLMPVVLAGAATAAFCAYLALYPALALGIAHTLFRHPLLRLAIGLPALWMISEWLRGTVFTGFPWVASGYAHTDGPLAGWAPTLGMYGVTLMAALLAGALSLLTLPQRRYGWVVAVFVMVIGGGWLSRTHSWTMPAGAPISVRLVQANVPQDLKFEPDGIARTFTSHLALMQGPRVDLVAMPESIFPVPMQHVPPSYLQTFREFAQQHQTAVIFGIFLEEPRARYFNSAVGYAPGDATLRRYSKRHLVPFGEFIPPGFRWFVDQMKMPIGDQQRGASAQPIALAGQRIAVNICYEDLFGAEIIDAWHTGSPAPTLMLNISNLAWFNDSLALPQHLQISRMRVLETQHPMLRATNTGATAIIDARGEVVAQAPYLTVGAVNGQVQGVEGMTPFIRFGNWPALGLAALLVLCALVRRK
ncbi:MAG TPA: apolipoprotein N-acyltransferase [Burkholderiaceae bacterium]|jgi:apolipoprotein N-acyltransferase|nr:apolipoprotein N-acyltransferase [Burkholderiaceae bacterium]